MYDVLINDFKIETSDIQFIKKQSRYVSVSVTSLAGVEITLDGGSKFRGIQFLDLMQYLAPGFSLDDFIRSFGSGKENEQKSYFPFEFMDSFDKLYTVTSLPPYDSFHSHLRNVNALNSEFLKFCLKNNFDEETGKRIEVNKRPKAGEEKYKDMLHLLAVEKME